MNKKTPIFPKLLAHPAYKVLIKKIDRLRWLEYNLENEFSEPFSSMNSFDFHPVLWCMAQEIAFLAQEISNHVNDKTELNKDTKEEDFFFKCTSWYPNITLSKPIKSYVIDIEYPFSTQRKIYR